MLERVSKAMQKYSNLSEKNTTDVEVEIKRIEADKEVNIKKIESEIEVKRMNLLADGKINFDQYIQLKNKII